MVENDGKHMKEIGRDLTIGEVKMWRMSLGVTKLDHMKSDQRIRYTFSIKEVTSLTK